MTRSECEAVVSRPMWRLRDLGPVVLWVLAFQLAVLIAASVLGLPTSAPIVPTSGGEVARQLVGSAATVTAVIVVAWRRGGVHTLVPMHVPRRKWVLLTLAITALLLLLKAAVATVLTPAERTVPLAVLLGSLLSVGMATAMEEELLYRGVLYGWLASMTRPAVAAVVSASVFAIEHSGLQPGGVVSAFCFGLLFAGLYRRSGSLLPGVVVHAVNNIGSLVVSSW